MGVFLDVGLTGGICSGKSVALRLLAAHDCFTIDADAIYHALIEPGRPLFEKLVERFGSETIDSDGRIDRAALGDIVFSNPEARSELDSITHPLIIEEQQRRKAEIREENPGGIVVTDAALMIEAGTFRCYDKVVVVHSDPERQLERLMRRPGIDEKAARRRIEAQMPATEKLRHADYKIRNDGSIEALKREVDEVYCYLILDLRAKERGDV